MQKLIFMSRISCFLSLLTFYCVFMGNAGVAQSNEQRFDTLYALNAVTGKPKWQFCSKESNFIRKWYQGYFEVIVDNQENVYASNRDGSIYCINDKGDQKWKFKPSKYLSDRAIHPIISNGILYTSYGGEYIYAINTVDGSTKWQRKIKTNGIETNLYIRDNVLYVTDQNRQLHAINGLNGKDKWIYKLYTSTYDTPISSKTEETIYIKDYDGTIYFIDNINGKHKSFSAVKAEGASKLFLSNNILYTTTYDSLWAINTTNGSKKWSFPLKNGGVITQFCASSEMVYVRSPLNVYAIDNKNGGGIWSYQIKNEDGISSDPVIETNANILCIASWEGIVYGLNASTGKQLWAFSTKDFKLNEITGRPFINTICADKSRVYLTTRKGKVYCINATNGKQVWSFQTSLESTTTFKIYNDNIYVYNRAYIMLKA